MIKKSYLKASKKLRYGPGGPRCSCCCIFPFKGRKHRMNRMARRTDKTLKEELTLEQSVDQQGLAELNSYFEDEL